MWCIASGSTPPGSSSPAAKAFVTGARLLNSSSDGSCAQTVVPS